jgi:hypothetical protein
MLVPFRPGSWARAPIPFYCQYPVPAMISVKGGIGLP